MFTVSQVILEPEEPEIIVQRGVYYDSQVQSKSLVSCQYLPNIMKGSNKWEEAWRAFDADIQVSHDASLFTGEKKEPKSIFDDLAEEFNVTTEDVSKSSDCPLYERAWRRLGAWIHRNDPTIEECSERYDEIIEDLNLDDSSWNEM